MEEFQLNANKVEVGKWYKYGKLCEMFNEDKETGNSKIAQVKRWKCYFNIEDRPKANFEIIEVYDTPKENIGRGEHKNSRNIVYADFLDTIMIDDLINREERVVYTTINQIAELTHMVQKNYVVAIKHKKSFREYVKEHYGIYNGTALNNVFYHTRNILRSSIDSCIRRLAKQSYIIYEYGHIIINHDDEIRMANDEEVQFIKKTDDEVMSLLNIEKKSNLSINEGLSRKFYHLTDSKIKNEFADVQIIFKGYKIMILGKQFDTKEDLSSVKSQLNELVKSTVTSNIESDYKNCKEDLEDFLLGLSDGFSGKDFKGYQLDMSDESYISSGEYAIETLLDMNSNDIKEG